MLRQIGDCLPAEVKNHAMMVAKTNRAIDIAVR